MWIAIDAISQVAHARVKSGRFTPVTSQHPYLGQLYSSCFSPRRPGSVLDFQIVYLNSSPDGNQELPFLQLVLFTEFRNGKILEILKALFWCINEHRTNIGLLQDQEALL
jgi:hypothetical protein